MLLALARAARAPAPVKVSATEALGTFRKTQEGTSRLPVWERLAPAVWDAVRDAAVQSSSVTKRRIGKPGDTSMN